MVDFSLLDSIEFVVLISSFIIFYIIYNVFKETFFNDDDRFNILKTISIIIISSLISTNMLFSENCSAESFKPMDLNSKKIDYLDISNTYNIYNNSIYDTSELFSNISYKDNAIHDYTELGNKNVTQIQSYENYNNFDKPTHTIYFDNTTYYDTINILSDMLYNFSLIDKIKIRYYYDDGSDDSSSNINVIYSDYKNLNIDNTTYGYNYSSYHEPTTFVGIDGIDDRFNFNNTLLGHNLNNSGSEIVNGNVYNYNFYGLYSHNPYGIYSDGVLHTSPDKKNIGKVNVNNITLKESQKVNLNKWDDFTINFNTIVREESLFSKSNFINIGLEKNNWNDILIIDRIEIQLIKTEISHENPFKEYYEFKNVTESNDLEIIFKMYAISDNYSNQESAYFLMYKNDANIVYLYMHINNTDYQYGNIIDDYDGFSGFQIHMYIDDDGFIYIYMYVKSRQNARTEENEIIYNYSKFEIQIKDRKYIYFNHFKYYDNSGSNDYIINYGDKSLKWDIVDKEITKIDVDDSGDIIFIKDIDSGGSRIPSISDIRHAISKALKPITIALTIVKDDLLKSIEDVTGQLTDLSGKLTSITSGINGLYGLITTQFSTITSNIDTMLGDLGLEITASIAGVNSAIAEIKTIIETIRDNINSLVTELDNIGDDLTSALDELTGIITALEDLYDIVAGEAGILETLISVGGAVIDFYDAWVSLLVYMVTYMGDWIQIATDYTGYAFTYLTNVLPIIPEILGISFSLFAFIFVIGLIHRMIEYRKTGDIKDLQEIMTYFHSIMTWIYGILINIITWITNMIP